MKAIIEYDLPDDELEFAIASNSLGWWRVLYDLDQHLRSKTKWSELTQEQYDVYEEVKDLLYNLMQENKVSLDE